VLPPPAPPERALLPGVPFPRVVGRRAQVRAEPRPRIVRWPCQNNAVRVIGNSSSSPPQGPFYSGRGIQWAGVVPGCRTGVRSSTATARHPRRLAIAKSLSCFPARISTIVRRRRFCVKSSGLFWRQALRPAKILPFVGCHLLAHCHKLRKCAYLHVESPDWRPGVSGCSPSPSNDC